MFDERVRPGDFATFDEFGSKVGYRPTHESCLMRDMLSQQFCSVDRENMWHQFLNHISLIDGVRPRAMSAAAASTIALRVRRRCRASSMRGIRGS